MEPLYTMAVTPRERVCVYPDMTSYPLDDVMGEGYGFIVLEGARGLGVTYGDTHGLEDAVRGLADNFYRGSSNGWWDKRNRAIGLYLNLMGFDHTIQMLRGSSQGDWAEVVIIRKRSYGYESNILESVPYVNAWFAGDVYSVIHEKLECYVNISSPEDTIERWNEIDAFHCQMILDVPKELPTLASIEFGLPLANWTVI
jgi:hypothetical protein